LYVEKLVGIRSPRLGESIITATPVPPLKGDIGITDRSEDSLSDLKGGSGEGGEIRTAGWYACAC